MLLTWSNYRTHLPESLWQKFRDLADRARGRPIIYINQALRYATIDEA